MFRQFNSAKSALPQPTKSGVIGPPKVKMPTVGGELMQRMSSSMPKASLGRNLKPLPKHPFHSMHGTAPSLLQTKSPSGLDGISKPKF